MHSVISGSSDEGGPKDQYVASYYDKWGISFVSGSGFSSDEALTDLYRRLEELGHDLSELPEPEPVID